MSIKDIEAEDVLVEALGRSRIGRIDVCNNACDFHADRLPSLTTVTDGPESLRHSRPRVDDSRSTGGQTDPECDLRACPTADPEWESPQRHLARLREHRRHRGREA